jgi:hypothetical protein
MYTYCMTMIRYYMSFLEYPTTWFRSTVFEAAGSIVPVHLGSVRWSAKVSQADKIEL